MKKIFSLIVLLAGVISFTSCGNDDATYTPVVPLEVSSTDVFFEANGGTGSIVINSKGTITAATSSSWITCSVSGNTINVVAQENPSRDGRSALIKITSSDGATTNVTATQKGLVFGIKGQSAYTIDGEATTFTVGVYHISPVTVKSQADWITAKFNDETDEIEIQIAENNTNAKRIGEIIIESVGMTETMKITQNNLDKNEDVTLYFQVEDEEGWYYIPATLSETSLNFELYKDTPWSLPIVMDKDKSSITVTAGSYLGILGPYYMYLVFYSSTDGVWTSVGQPVSTTTTMTATFESEETEEGTYYDALFNGKMEAEGKSYTLDGWIFYAFSTPSFSTDSGLGYLDRIYNIIIERFEPNPSAVSARKVKAIKKNAKPFKESNSTQFKLNKY